MSWTCDFPNVTSVTHRVPDVTLGTAGTWAGDGYLAGGMGGASSGASWAPILRNSGSASLG